MLSEAKSASGGKIRTVPILSILFAFAAVVWAQVPDMDKSIADLQNPQMSVRLMAVQALAQTKEAKAEEALITRLKKENDAYIRIQIIDVLTLYQSTGALKAVLSGLSDPNPQVRQSAAIDTGYFGDNDTIAVEISKLLDSEKDEAVKFSAVNALGQNRTKPAVDALGKVLKKEKGAKMRKFALKRLDVMNTKEANDEIKKNSANADLEIRKEAGDIIKRKKIK
jgi:HEAT repeat protein